jgi:sulfite reductase beta subunit-like hemoprotein
MRQWSSFHPEFSYLPRKFKIAVIASEKDRAAMRLHDIGIRIVKRDGEVGAQFYAGGGMGRTPMIAPLIRDFVPLDQLITYAEAALRVYNRYGRRDNKYKAGSNPRARNWRGLRNILPIRPSRTAPRPSTGRTRISPYGWIATPTATSTMPMSQPSSA